MVTYLLVALVSVFLTIVSLAVAVRCYIYARKCEKENIEMKKRLNEIYGKKEMIQ